MNCAGQRPNRVSGGMEVKRALNVVSGLANSSRSHWDSISGLWKVKTLRLEALGSSRLVKRVSIPVDW